PGRAGRMFSDLRDHPPTTVAYIKDGKRYFLTNLILGTITVSHNLQLLPGRSEDLKIEFEPHPVMRNDIAGAFVPDEIITTWYARPQYQPRTVSAQYDLPQSGGKTEERRLDLRGGINET